MSEQNSDEADFKQQDSSFGELGTDFREHDRYLPIANVGRVMRNALPPHGKLSKEAKETVQECVSEFISFITSQAAEKCSIEKRKTLNGEDILFAMYSLGFENYSETLKIYLAKYREFEQYELEAKKNTNRPKRPYHRKNPKNRPKHSNRFTSSSRSPSDEYLAKNNLPALVPTSLLSIPSSESLTSQNSLQLLQLSQFQFPQSSSTKQQPIAQYQSDSQQSLYSQSNTYIPQYQPQQQEQQTQQPVLQVQYVPGFQDPATLLNSDRISPSYPASTSGYYTYSGTGSISQVNSDGSVAGSSDDFGEIDESKEFQRFPPPASEGTGNLGNSSNNRSASGSTGNLVNYGDFMNL